MSGKQEFRGLKGLKKQRRIQVIALVLLYVFPEIGMWLPDALYK